MGTRSRRMLIAGNWKMNKTSRAALELAVALKAELRGALGADVAVCPPFTALGMVGEALAGSPIALGAQNLHWKEEGAYTGEVSAAMLRDLGCRYVIVGHSERRRLFGETNETVNRKIIAALAAGLSPIVCVGETLEKREQGVTDEVLRKQLQGSLAGLDGRALAGLTVAYEPVWAIGTGRTAAPAQAEAAHRAIRLWAGERYGGEAGGKLVILYGGSVTPANAAQLLAMEEIDGALVGGASLDAASFAAIVKAAG